MNKTVGGSLLIASGTIYKIILSLFIDKYLALKLGVDSFGQYKYGITIVLLLSTFSTLGFNTSIIREIAIQKKLLAKKKILSIVLFLIAVTSFIIIGFILVSNSLFEIQIPFILATFFFGINTVYNSIYSGLEQPKSKAIINDFLGFTLYLMFLFLFFQLENKFKLKEVSFVYLIYTISVFIMNIVFSKKYIIKISRRDFLSEDFKRFLKYTWPLFGVSILIILSANLDKFILNYYVSDTQLGLYYAVFNVSNLLPLILTILVFLYLPRMSNFLQNGKQNKAALISSYSSKWTMIIASIFFGAIIYYTDDLLKLLYSKQFEKGALVLQILALGQWINVSLGFTGQNLLALGDSKSQLYIRTVTFIIGAILLVFGVKYYGNIGASISILISLLCSNVLQIIILKTKHNFVGYRKQNMFTVIIVIVTGILLSYIHKISYFENINFMIMIFIDTFIFILLLVITKNLDKKDLRILKITDGK
ncbi:oligosaccharide flippase family protein [Cellulophaga sp. E16_2]|uniref:oligosaccharide flippase family protein n=1 Tax=unclassified Cellulophaga TaxID=2634405 RepID=UPI0013FD9891|nr:oligosaccharide flippase family protein [Cellulophaga sp. Z1A5H]MBO0591362.1 oligosaccharide flippase family protein [Cellulophaga sp. E16_2]